MNSDQTQYHINNRVFAQVINKISNLITFPLIEQVDYKLEDWLWSQIENGTDKPVRDIVRNHIHEQLIDHL